MAFDPIQEDCHRLVLEALRRDNIPLTDGAAVERLMEQFTRNPAPLIVHDRDRAGHLIAKVVEAVDYRIPFIPDDTQAEQEEAAAENMLREAAAARSDQLGCSAHADGAHRRIQRGIRTVSGVQAR